MKTFKQLVNEVAEPKAGDEKRFKAKHVVAKYSHPSAEEGQFTAGKVKKDKTKPAGYHDGEDKEVYEETELDEGLFNKKPKINIGKLHDFHAYHEKKSEAHATAQQKYDSNSRMADHHSHQANEHDTAAEHLHNASKAYDKGDHKAVAKHVGLYNKTSVSRFGIKEEADVHTKRADKKAIIVHDVDAQGKSKTITRQQRAGEIKVESYKSFDLDETFKMGLMKLKDGKTVKLSKEEAEAVNSLFNELNSSNKKRMQEEMMKNKSGFDKVLKFAKEAM